MDYFKYLEPFPLKLVEEEEKWIVKSLINFDEIYRGFTFGKNNLE